MTLPNPSVPMTSLHIDHVIHDVLDAHPLYARDCPDGLDKFNCSHVVEIIKTDYRTTDPDCLNTRRQRSYNV
jgi:hypothetical protein